MKTILVEMVHNEGSIQELIVWQLTVPSIVEPREVDVQAYI